MRASGSDRAIAALLKWAAREEWRDRFETIIAAHLAPGCEAAGVAPDELPDLLGEDAHSQLIGCVFEDFLTREFEPDGRNVIDDYLKRRGWTEPTAVKHYLQALRRSTMSVYEVVDTTPGSHFVVRDLVRGGEPVRVKDKLGSQSVARWDRLAARLLLIEGETQMTGGALLLDFDAATAAVEAIAELSKSLGRRAEREGVPQEALAMLPVDGAVLGQAAPLITQTWLVSALEQARGSPLPKLVNFDGEELVFCEARFPLADPGRAEEVTAHLDRLPDVHRDEPDEPAWTWTTARKASRGKARGTSRKALKLATFDAEGGPVLGSVRLEGGAVVLTANSVERIERGREMLREALGTLVKAPLTSMQTTEQVLAERAAEGDADVVEEPPLPPEETEAIMREMLDQHYRGVLSEPVSMLGGKSPRQAARSKAGRQKVAEWLKYLENQTARRAGADSMPAYDFGWMWEELKIADLRR
ncbi:MAG TPA: hypothetical protein VFY87_13575 [Geminicoccaceae bacterium]|nr:hypothetical protein [Geminicoccaceae bacterium]